MNVDLSAAISDSIICLGNHAEWVHGHTTCVRHNSTTQGKRDGLRVLNLRVRTFSHKTFQIYYVYFNFILGNMCRITVIF